MSFIEIEEGLKKTAAFIQPMVLQQPTGPSWWQAKELHERLEGGAVLS